MISLDPREARLLNDFQRGLPLVREPYAAIARELAQDESWVRATLARWRRDSTFRRSTSVVTRRVAASIVPDKSI